MKYIGLYSGEIYDNKEEADVAEECCLNVRELDSRLSDEQEMLRWRREITQRCHACKGCPRSRK